MTKKYFSIEDQYGELGCVMSSSKKKAEKLRDTPGIEVRL